VMRELRVSHPEWFDPDKDFRHFVDPAGFDRKDTDERTCVQEMEEHAGIRNIEPGPMLWEPRKKAVNHFLTTLTGDGPALQLAESSSPVLFAGFTGGYQYPEKMEEIEPAKARPLKNKYSHPHDAFQYLCGGIESFMTEGEEITIPTPQYGFTKKSESKERDQRKGAGHYGYE